MPHRDTLPPEPFLYRPERRSLAQNALAPEPLPCDEVAETGVAPEKGDCCRGYHHGDLRRGLLQVARDLLVERGVPGTSLRAIARRAGVSNRAPYHHFEDKLSLLAELAREGFAEFTRRMLEHESVEDPVERLRRQGRSYVRFATEFPSDFEVMYWPELCDRENFPDREECAKPAFDALIRALSEIAGPNATEEQLDEVAVAGWAGVHGLATLQAQSVLSHLQEEGMGESETAVIDGILDCTNRMLVGEARRVGGLDCP